MKGFIKLLTAILTSYIFSVLVGCTKENYYFIDAPNDKDEDTYTIMLYGTGGGDLDPEMMINLNEAIIEGVNDRVQFTGQVKFSKEWQQENPEVRGTLRFSLKDVVDGQIVPAEVLSQSLPMYEPETLADFITWSKQAAPADQYILVLWNHGDGWRPKYDKPKTRAICVDDNVEGKLAMSLGELVEGIKLSNTHFKMIYYDACLMAVIENYAGLADLTDYILGSSHSTPAIGGDYSSLIYNLKHSVNFEETITTYCNDVIRHWELDWDNHDIGLFKMSYMDDVLKGAAILSEILTEIIEIDPATEQYDPDLLESIEYAFYDCYRYNSLYPYFDLGQFGESVANCVRHEKYTPILIRAASMLSRALARSFVCSCKTSYVPAKNLTIGVTILEKQEWQDLGYEGVYETLDFDRYTKWGKWLKINPINIYIDSDSSDWE